MENKGIGARRDKSYDRREYKYDFSFVGETMQWLTFYLLNLMGLLDQTKKIEIFRPV